MNESQRRKFLDRTAAGTALLSFVLLPACSRNDIYSRGAQYRPENRIYASSAPEICPAPIVEAPAPAAWEPDYRVFTQQSAANVPATKAWRLLMYGNDAAARDAFTVEAETYPKLAEPKIGYSLASASLGEYSTGIWAMRRAIESDPDSVASLNLGQWSDEPVERLVERYEQFRYENPQALGPRFMVAALQYLRDQPELAREALGPEPVAGWSILSTRRLDAMIRARIASSRTDPTPEGISVTPPASIVPAIAFRDAPPRTIPPSIPSPTPAGAPSAPLTSAVSVASLSSTATGENAPTSPNITEVAVAKTPADDTPREPGVGYEVVRRGLLQAAAALDGFSVKLSKRLEEAKPGTVVSASRVSATAPPKK